MTANPILLQKKYSRVIECFAKQQGLSLDAALDFFYHSLVYQLIRDGVSDMHCICLLYTSKKQDLLPCYLGEVYVLYHRRMLRRSTSYPARYIPCLLYTSRELPT